MSQGTNPILKPIQYLGAKTRALDTILSECLRLYRQDTYVLDLFSGSRIVSQALYHSSPSRSRFQRQSAYRSIARGVKHSAK